MIIGAVLILTWLVLLLRYPAKALPISLAAVCGLGLVALFARVTAPFMPEAAGRIAATVGATDLSWPDAEEDLLNLIPAGQTVAAAQVLFAKIEDAQVAEWTERFGGAES